MTSRLPFDALRSFALIARGLSAAEAAEALNVSPGAVSQRIAALEAQLDRKLVQRRAGRLQPTAEGAAFFAEIRESLEAVEGALAGAAARRTIRLHATPAFADAWLIPRLEALQRLLPGWALEVSTSAEPFEARRSWTSFDAAFRYGAGAWPGLTATPVVAPGLALVCSERISQGDARALIARLPLLRQPGLPDWPLWLDALGLSDDAVSWGPSFNDDAGCLRAAACGLGLAVVRACTVRAGAGVRVVERKTAATLPTYHLVTRLSDASFKPAALLHAWASDQEGG